MKKHLSLLLLCLMALMALTACGEKSTAQSGGQGVQQAESQLSEYETELMASDYAAGTHHVEINVAELGTISVELDADTAPITTANFCTLAEKGFYDGLTFHRIMNGFMIQGGDPLGNGTGGASTSITGEFEANGIANDISHKRGVISMARATPPNSASSQFFIVHQDADFLDGQYAAFGMVTDGMEIVDEVAENTPVEDNNGTVKMENQPVIESVVVVD